MSDSTTSAIGADIQEALTVAAAAAGGLGATYVAQLLGAFAAAEPAIVSGVASAEPFIAAGVSLIESGGAPDDAAWTAQLAALSAQTTAIDNQVAADEAAQPGS
ncbi:MAG TPA: hypothetical protein VL418_03900 [Devosiaceae bacterium]|nr:hypothetical protein [Devosiaceae bacterium]